MALTEEQRDAIETIVAALNAEVNGIVAAREDVNAILRLDEHDPTNVHALAAVQAAKARAAAHAVALNTLLTAP